MSWLFASGGQSIALPASVLQMNIEGWYALGLTGLISLLSKGPSSLLQYHISKASILQHSAFFMVPLSHPYLTTGKTIALIIQIFVVKLMSLIFNTLSSSVIAFLPRNKHLLISWLQSLSAVNLESKKIKSVTVSVVSPFIYHEVVELEAMILVFWMLRFKPAFSLFSFIKRLLVPLHFLP